MSTPAPVAGWYPDPAGRFQHRYYDGRRWTATVATNGISQQDAAGVASHAPSNVTAPAAGAAATTASVPRRSAAGFWIAGAVGAVAVIVAIALGVTRFVDTLTSPDNYTRGTVPGVLTVPVNDPGKRLIYSEGYPRVSLGELGVTISGPDGAPVTVRTYDSDLTYDTSGHNGRAIGSFQASDTGAYIVTLRGASVSGAEIAVGTDLFSDLLGIFIGPLLVGLIGLAVALGIVFYTFWWRRRPPPEAASSGLT